jgi:phytoene desaturase
MKVGVIGSGFAGISSACFLAKEGYDVTVFEKNSTPGGRARKFTSDGFTFDMGPSWYWMPDVFESFFKQFDKKPSDYYELQRLDPSYRIFYSKDEVMDLPAGVPGICAMFEKLEPGSSIQLLKFLQEGKHKYEVGMNSLVYKPGLSLAELLDFELLTGAFKLHVFQSIATYIRKYFKHPHLIQLLEFPVLFLGASPKKTPALYSLMNYADMSMGTWYPKGGMYKIIEGMVSLATSLGVRFEFNSTVQEIVMTKQAVSGLRVNDTVRPADYIVAAADYHHVEQNLLPAPFRQYTGAYWQSRTMAPSSLIFYVGINKRLKNLIHHNLFFDQNFEQHAKEIYDNPSWPENPLFYVCCTSKNDATVAPPDHENLFILIPVAPSLADNDETRQKYFDQVVKRLEYLTNEKIREHIVYQRSYAHADFMADYNAYRGNAYGLANTLWQTANLKPTIASKKVKNLFYAGQLTVPGPGVPPALISGQVVARELIKQHNIHRLKEKSLV